MLDDPHLLASVGLVPTTLPGSEDATIRSPALPVAFDGERPSGRCDPPGIGEQHGGILRELGRDQAAE